MATENQILTQGATITELAVLFGMDRKDVRLRLNGVMPTGKRANLDVWRVKDVAPKLVKLDDSMTEMVSRVLSIHHNDLPKMLSKEYWYGQNQRVKFLQTVGDLWDTAAVVRLAADVFKTFRISLMLSADAVERETGLTPRQREIITEQMSGALDNVREKLVDQFSGLGEDASGKAFAPKENFTVVGPHPGGDPWDDGDDDPDFRIPREPRPGDPDYI